MAEKQVSGFRKVYMGGTDCDELQADCIDYRPDYCNDNQSFTVFFQNLRTRSSSYDRSSNK